MYKLVVLLIFGVCTFSVHGINQTEVSKRINSISQQLVAEYGEAVKGLDNTKVNLKDVAEQLLINANSLILGRTYRQRYALRELENEAFMKVLNISSCIVPSKAIFLDFLATSSLQAGECIGKFRERAGSLCSLTQGILQDILDGPRTLAVIVTNCPYTYKDDPKCVDKVYQQLLIHEAGTLEHFRSEYNNFISEVQAIAKRMALCGDKELELVHSVGDDMLHDIKECIERVKKGAGKI